MRISLPAALSAAIWGGLTVLTGYHFAFLAIGVGLLVGMVVRFHGATGFVYGLLAAALALFGCLAGDVLSGCFFVAWEQQVPYMEVVRGLSFTQASEIIADVFSPYDVLLYGLAMLEAFKLGAGGRIIKH